MPLTTLSDVKTILGVTTSSEDARLMSLILAVEDQVKNYCRQTFEYQDAITEYHDLHNGRFVTLNERPVVALASLHYDPDRVFGSDRLLVANQDYLLGDLNGGVVELFGGMVIAPRYRPFDSVSVTRDVSRKVIKAVYSAGYQDMPEDLKLAIALLVGFFRTNAKFGGAGMIGEARLQNAAYKLSNIFTTGNVNVQGVQDSTNLYTARGILQKYAGQGMDIV